MAVVAFVLAGGCDWFDSPAAVNLPPGITIDNCSSLGEIHTGDPVTIRWTGTDPDGQIVGYEWALDDTLDGTTAETSITFRGLPEGDHTFAVAAIDDDDEIASPATCGFTVSVVGRVVLAELLTTKFCSNCWKAELALDRMIERYGRGAFCAIAYHYDDDENIPPDPVANDDSNARCDWYYENTDVGEHYAVFPLTVFDGGRFVVGAPDTTSTKAAYVFETDLRRDVPAPLTLEVEGALEGARGDVVIGIRVHEELSGGPNVLRMVVIEDEIMDGSFHFDFVARDILDEETLAVSAVGDSAVVERSFSLDPGWSVEHLDIIAFVQDDSSGEVLQAGRLMTQ